MANKKILITRPKGKGSVFADLLCQSNIGINMDDFIFEPMMEINNLSIKLPDLNSYDGVIVTSNYAREVLPKNYSCYRVGEDAPTAKDLADKIIHDNRSKKLCLLYIRGEDIAFDLKGRLTSANHSVDELISYKAMAINRLSENTKCAINKGEIFAVYFFSKRSADIFVRILTEAGVLGDIKGIKALCISDNVAKALCGVFGDNVEVSDSPDVRGMIKMII